MSKTDFVLEAQPRTQLGKGASRRLRRLDQAAPAIIYGAGKEPMPISIRQDSILHAIENEAFFSSIIEVKLGRRKEQVVIKDLQRHPSRPVILHADFLRVSADQVLHVKVPLHFLNEDACVGVKQEAGQISHLMNELDISCLPKDLPEFIEVDMAAMRVGESVHISDLKLPEGVSSVDLSHGEAGDHAVASVHVKRRQIQEEPEAAPSDEEAEQQEGEDSGEDKSGQ